MYCTGFWLCLKGQGQKKLEKLGIFGGFQAEKWLFEASWISKKARKTWLVDLSMGLGFYLCSIYGFMDSVHSICMHLV